MRAPRTKSRRRASPATVSARLLDHVSLEAQGDGKIAACFGGYSVTLGRFSAEAADRAQDLRTGLPLASFESGGQEIDLEIDRLVRRLAGHGLVEYRVGSTPSADEDLFVIEPQAADYWPRKSQLDDADTLALSRFAFIRRRGNEMVLELPRSRALFRLCDPKIASAIAVLATPQPVGHLRRQDGFPGLELLALLADCQILFKIDTAGESGARSAEGDDSLVLWDFHDLLFHARSTEGRHANPLGGTYPYAGAIVPLPAVRPRWPGKKIDLGTFPTAPAEAISPLAGLLRQRHSVRGFDDRHPIALGELSQFLDATARVLSRWRSTADPGDGIPEIEYATRPYPSAGSAYELELYLAVDRCEGLARGFYHYDAEGHALTPIDAGAPDLEALMTGAQSAMGSAAVPQILITIAARFGRISWKYSSIAYALILKDAGVLLQTFYLMATDLRLGGCAIGISNIDLFAGMTGIAFHVEGPVGQFALGRGAPAETAAADPRDPGSDSTVE